jgi:hypothetical protein
MPEDEFKPFEVDTAHLFDVDIPQHYTYPLEEAAIVENVDNALDERYEQIEFQTTEDLAILMIGDGMPKEVFEEVLPKLAATTKWEEEATGLGRHGWGMKIGLKVADEMRIETKKGTYHAAQIWKVINRVPHKKFIQPEMDFQQDFTLIKFKGFKRDEEFVRRVLQKFYPTVLGGTKVKNKYGESRKLIITINSKPVPPPQQPKIIDKEVLKATIAGEDITGYVFLTEEKLPQEERGINIIVRGRAITRDSFGIDFGEKNDRITGYIHADLLLPDLYGDKTNFKRTGRYRSLVAKLSQKLYKFAERIGAVKTPEPVGDVIKKVYKDLNELLKNFPELHELFKKTGGIHQDQFMPKKGGDILSTLGEGMTRERGIEPGEKGGSGVPHGPGNEKGKAPTGEAGEKGAIRKRRKGGLEIRPIKDPGREESWFSPPGVVFVNQLFPTYLKAEKYGKKTLIYHVGRVALEGILTYVVEQGYVEENEAKNFKMNVLARWAELL